MAKPTNFRVVIWDYIDSKSDPINTGKIAEALQVSSNKVSYELCFMVMEEYVIRTGPNNQSYKYSTHNCVRPPELTGHRKQVNSCTDEIVKNLNNLITRKQLI